MRPIPLLDFIPALSPRYTRVEHLARMTSLFERAMHERVFAFVTTPPRHGKSETIKHAIVHRLLANPRTRIAYSTYAQKFANKMSREVRKLYIAAGGEVEKGAALIADWRTGTGDGGLWAAGAGGQWTGLGFDLIIIDDPVKSRAIAESAVEREKLWDWFVSDLETRLEPGSSLVAVHTRWTTDDLGGRLLANGCVGRPVEHVHLPAIDSAGEALWPMRYPIEELRRIEASKGAYDWASLYMGAPFPKGGRVFNDVSFYDVLPDNLRIALGIDLAYSAKTHADYSVAVVLGVDDVAERFYVLNVVRRQEKAPQFAERIKALQATNAVEARWYYAGAEKGIIDFAETLGIGIDAQAAASDKFIRSQPVAAAWNERSVDHPQGRIFLPRKADWLDDFVTELASFTGVKDLHDDQVDALAAAFDSAAQPGWVTAFQRWRAAGAKPLFGQPGTGIAKLPTTRPI